MATHWENRCNSQWPPDWSYPLGKNWLAESYPRGRYRLARSYPVQPVITLLSCWNSCRPSCNRLRIRICGHRLFLEWTLIWNHHPRNVTMRRRILGDLWNRSMWKMAPCITEMLKQLVTRDGVPGILLACHDNPATGGHFGRDKTYKKIQARYWWKAMKTEIEEYIQNCEKCFEHKPKLLTDRPELHPIPVPSKALSLVGIDSITNLPETARGNKNIVAASDHFSKWTEAVALPDKSAASVGDFLYKLILRHGCMDRLR